METASISCSEPTTDRDEARQENEVAGERRVQVGWAGELTPKRCAFFTPVHVMDGAW